MANETPDSDFSIECFRNYSAPEVFVQGLAGMVDQTDIENIIRSQKVMLQRFEKTTEMLTNCNQLSASRLRAASAEFKKHTQLLLDMKKDLEFIFRKIRLIKNKLSTQYPEAYRAAVEKVKNEVINEDLEEPKDQLNTTTSNMIATVSTETLKAPDIDKAKHDTESIDKSKSRSIDNKHRDSESIDKKMKNLKESSSPETESASSGDENSTDTG